ncbi:MAG: MlaD family protein [Planctomycetota bacterium]
MGDRSAEIRAGIVVLIALGILALGLFVVTGGWEQFEDKAYYTIHFPNAGGIGEGDLVYLAGQRAGSVKQVDQALLRRQGKQERFVAVRVEVAADYEIPVDSTFIIESTITGTLSLHIEYGSAKELAKHDSELFGRRRATMSEAIDNANAIVSDVRDGVKMFQGLMADARTKLAQLDFERIQAKVDDILDTIGRAAVDVEVVVDDAKKPISNTLRDIAVAAANVKKLSGRLNEDWDEMEPKVHTILENVRQASADLRGVLEENRPGVKSIVQNVDDASRRIGPVLEKLEGVGKEVEEAVIELRPELMRTVKGASKAMDNFKSLTEELKTAPWKLINKPSESESDDVHFYNAARLYVEAAAKIGENIDDLDTLRRLGVLEDPDRAELVEKVLRLLDQSLRDFDDRQQRLVAMMKERRGQ